MSERQPNSREEVSFGQTLNPDIRRISDNGRYVGILLLHGKDFVAEWYTKNGSSLRTPLYVLEAVVKERDRIVEERKQRK